MEGEWLTVSTLNGTVYLTVVPKDNHREHIFEKLSQALGCTVTAQDLKTRPGSTRPEFSKLPVDANWTHSKDICVLAYSRDCRVGIDLEFHSKNRLKLADRFYSGEEAERIHQVEQTEGENAAIKLFYTLWCRKEAFYKCVGGEFFEGSLRRNMLKSPVQLDASGHEVHFVDLDAAVVGMQTPAALCIAVSRL